MRREEEKTKLQPAHTTCDPDLVCWAAIPTFSHVCHGFKMQNLPKLAELRTSIMILLYLLKKQKFN